MNTEKITGTGTVSYFPPDRQPPASKYYHSINNRKIPLTYLHYSEAHNERRTASPSSNSNIDPDRTALNIFYTDRGGKGCREALDERIAQGLYTFGELQDGKQSVTEFCIGANAEYFDQYGGYAFAKRYADCVAEFILNRFPPEEILSLVFHADEIDPTLTTKYRHPVYHYHLHLLHVPVVIRDWKVRGCPPGTPVISHAARWSFRSMRLTDGSIQCDADGKPVRIGGYRQFRDALTAYLHDAGFPELEDRPPLCRVPLPLWDYKARLAEARVRELEDKIRQADETLRELTALKADINRVDIGEKQRNGSYLLNAKDYRNLVALARTGVAAGPMLRREAEHYKLLLDDYDAQRHTLLRMRDRYREAVADSLCFRLASRERKDRFRAISLIPETESEIRIPRHLQKRVS